MAQPVYPGGKCYWCNKDLGGPSLTCTNETIVIDGVRYDRIRYGYEIWRENETILLGMDVERDHKPGRCPDCGVLLREPHHFCCDLEQCPCCKEFLLGCACSEVAP